MTLTLTLADVSDALRAPFPPGIEQYRVGATWERDGTRWTRPLAFVTARDVFDRLDEVVGPDGWASSLVRLSAGVYLATLTVLGVARSDVGMAGANEGEPEKAGASDAMKRAAVQFGVGRYLYSQELPATRLEPRGGDWVLPHGWRPSASVAAGGLATAQPAARVRPATPAQLRKIQLEVANGGWSEAELARLLDGRDLADLNSIQASRLIDHLVAAAGQRRQVG